MNYFKHLNYPNFPNLITDLFSMIENNTIYWNGNQICINSTKADCNNFLLGTGSLSKNWNKSVTKHSDKITSITVPLKENQLKEEEFTEICPIFQNTQIEKIYNFLSNKYILGRVRFIKSDPRTCMSWHKDSSTRIHYSLSTDEGCMMVIENEIIHMPRNTWWLTNTTMNHTAFNASMSSRIHLVAVILSKKQNEV